MHCWEEEEEEEFTLTYWSTRLVEETHVQWNTYYQGIKENKISCCKSFYTINRKGKKSYKSETSEFDKYALQTENLLHGTSWFLWSCPHYKYTPEFSFKWILCKCTEKKKGSYYSDLLGLHSWYRIEPHIYKWCRDQGIISKYNFNTINRTNQWLKPQQTNNQPNQQT